MATDESKIKAADTTAAKPKKREMGLSAEGKAYPGVDPDTGERKAVTWDGLRAEFGIRAGSKLYNDIAVAGYGGVQPNRPALSLLPMQDKYMRPQGKHETAEEYAKVAERFGARRAKVESLLAEAEAQLLKGE